MKRRSKQSVKIVLPPEDDDIKAEVVDDTSPPPAPDAMKDTLTGTTKETKERAKAKSSAEEDADDGNFEVEQIVDMDTSRKWKCPVKFRVRWIGYGEKDDTWLPASELSCEELVNEFLEISGRNSEYKQAMTPRTPKNRNISNGERTVQTRNVTRISYSELDEDEGKSRLFCCFLQ
ncbi:hypothetical protein SK128_017168 [Halocaridina rubra]|uniref:Chromo domain-containing protein n=1 Tax=Halocaridina rubra TaxID=373956 RepID=A0AAN8ZSB0_HALRR